MRKKNAIAAVLRACESAYAAIPNARALPVFEPAGVDARATLARIAETRLPTAFLALLKLNRLGHGLPNGYDILSPEMMISRAEGLKRLWAEGAFKPHFTKIKKGGTERWDDRKIQRRYWHHGWIPFAEDSCGNALCVDTTPARDGMRGQIVMFENQDGRGPFLYWLPDLTMVLGTCAIALEEQAYTRDLDPEYGDIITPHGKFDVGTRIFDRWADAAKHRFS
jgi:cell wall assembly regulator SMI1